MRLRMCRGMAKIAMAGKLHWRRFRSVASLERNGALRAACQAAD
jgi:hypothetical protein